VSTVEQLARSLMQVHVEASPEYREDSVTTDLLRECAIRALGGAGVPAADERSVERLTAWAEMQFNVRQAEAARLRGDDVDHVPWVDARRGELFPPNGFWSHYRLLLEPKLPPRALNRLDRDTDRILDSLESPDRDGQWDRRGLVMGQVQSGKTNSYLGLIAKAADAGYRLIVVLAGIHNSLRSQTQSRLDEAIVGRDTTSGTRSSLRIGVGLRPRHPGVYTMTSAEENGDFRRNVADAVGNPFTQSDICTVFVVKKHVSILGNLHDWLSDNSNMPPGHERIAGFPLLVIDDEADNASIDTTDHTGEEDCDPTRTNLGIRRLLNLFDQSAYVGYTATPYANVFIDDRAEHEEGGDDLFPRDFIYSLQAPTNYVGAARIFGSGDPTTGTGGELPLVHRVTDAEDWIPPQHRSDHHPDEKRLPESLVRAVRSFILSCAARRLRGATTAHNSMLIHVTRFVAVQEAVKNQVEDLLLAVRNQILYADPDHEIWDTLAHIWEQDFVPAAESLLTSDDPPPLHTFDEVRAHLTDAVSPITVRAINGTSADVLDYRQHQANGHSAIVIGGDKLSRGLTLEGLTVSYYLRTTKMYDTLMQMGRWFGYRPGHLDLCRIYTSTQIVYWYQQIAAATEEMLEDFRAMQEAGARPKDFGLRVRHSPGMLITNPSKMRNGSRHRVNFGGMRPETTSFEIDPARRQLALDHLGALIGDLNRHSHPQVGRSGDDRAWRDLPAEPVIAYLDRLADEWLYPAAVSARPVYVSEYIRKRVEQGGLVRWTVLLRSNSLADLRKRWTAPDGSVDIGLSYRSDRGVDGRYTIRSLIGSRDEAFDLSEAQIEAASVASGGDGVPHGTWLRKQRPTTDGLLILYVLDPGVGDEHEGGNVIPDGPAFAAYCLSLPDDPDNTAVDYVANSVFDRDMLGDPT
jgi:hypothetical protein